MRRRVPSFFSRDPSGEQCRLGIGGDAKGPDICFLESSLLIAVVISVGKSVVERRLGGWLA